MSQNCIYNYITVFSCGTVTKRYFLSDPFYAILCNKFCKFSKEVFHVKHLQKSEVEITIELCRQTEDHC